MFGQKFPKIFGPDPASGLQKQQICFGSANLVPQKIAILLILPKTTY